MLHEISGCEVCGNNKLTPVLNIGLNPMCDDLVAIGDSRVCKEYPIEIIFCDNCKTGHQRYQIPKQELFPQNYHYRSRHTADVLDGMKELVQSIEDKYGSLEGKKILDIGCNDGSLLSFFRDKGAKTFGIEPTGASKDAIAAGHDVINDYFSEDIARLFVERNGQPDFITFTNVFAHIEDLKAVVRALKIAKREETVIVIENHYLGAVLDRFQFDTFYHEHPRTYSYTSFAFIGDMLDMRIGRAQFPERYNGNIRVCYEPIKDDKSHADWNEITKRESGFLNGLLEMASQIEPWRKKKIAEIDREIKQYGKLKAKAFPGRAAIPMKLLDIGDAHIAAVYEKPGSEKIGHYVPGTRIPILSDEEFDPKQEAPIFNLAWHISKEIHRYMRSRGFNGKIIDIISIDDAPAMLKDAV